MLLSSLLLLAAVVGLAACGGPTPTPTPSADQIVELSRQAMAAMSSYRLSGEVESGNDDEPADSFTVTGEWLAPDRTHFRAEPSAGGSRQLTETINIGDRFFITENGDHDWRELPGSAKPSVLPGVPPEVDARANLIGAETIEGQEVYHLKVEYSDGDPDNLGPGERAVQGTQDWYVSTEDYRLVRSTIDLVAHFKESAADANSPPEWFSMKTMVNLHDYDTPVVIEVPELADQPAESTVIPPPITPTPTLP